MFVLLLAFGTAVSNIVVQNMIYKELYQQVSHLSSNGSEFPGIASVISEKKSEVRNIYL